MLSDNTNYGSVKLAHESAHLYEEHNDTMTLRSLQIFDMFAEKYFLIIPPEF